MKASRLRRPPITPENYEQWVKHYTDLTDSRRGRRASRRLVLGALGNVWPTSVSYHGNALEILKREGASHPAYGEHRDRGLRWLRLVVAANHSSALDPIAMGAVLNGSRFRKGGGDPEAFRPSLDSLFPISKRIFFNLPPITGLPAVFDAVDALPAIRKKDFVEAQTPTDLRRSVENAQNGLYVHRLMRGWSMGVFPPGEREKDDPRRISELHDGFRMLPVMADRQLRHEERHEDIPDTLFVPLAIRQVAGGLLARVHVGEPRMIAAEAGRAESREIGPWMRESIQAGLDTLYA